MNRLQAGEARTIQAAIRRGAIVAFLQENPGASLRQVSRQLGLAVGAARHHLGILEREGRVWHERLGCKDWHFVGPRPRRRNSLKEALQTGLPRELGEVLGLVRRCGPLPQKDALDVLPWPRSTSQHRLDQLVRMGHLRRRPQGRRVLYEVAA